jgi:galactose mutarotase-like enzyme
MAVVQPADLEGGTRITIANGEVAFVSDSHGAELHSLRFADEELDYLWMPAGPELARTSTCFPLLGTVPEGRYELAGHVYDIPMHGFARSTDFDVVERSSDSVTYEMTDTTETLAAYPFPFRLRVRYSLEGATLVTEYTVDNPGEATLLYSVGAHPRFTCPVDPDEGLAFADHRLVFDEPEGPEKVVRTFGSREAVDSAFISDRRTLRLDDGLFTEGAFCFGPLTSDRVVLSSDRSTRGLALNFPGASHLQVWSIPGSAFVALEPWYGAITANPPRPEDRFWDRRPGTLELEPGATATRSFRITPMR